MQAKSLMQVKHLKHVSKLRIKALQIKVYAKLLKEAKLLERVKHLIQVKHLMQVKQSEHDAG